VRESERVQLSERDQRILGFVADHPFVLARHVAAVLGITSSAAARRLLSLSQAGYLLSDDSLRREPMSYRVTAKALRTVGSDLPTPPKVNLATYRHEAGLAWLAIGAERGMFGPVTEVISERRMRSRDGRSARHKEQFGVRLGGPGLDGRDRLHYPDLLVVTETGHRVAFELELTGKGRRRRERILMGYALDRRIDAVVYLVDHAARRRALQESVRRLGLEDRVRVEAVKLGHRPHSRAPARAAKRTTTRASGRERERGA
jgi:hypothetical protein